MSITAATAIGGSFKHVKGQRVQIKAPETTEVVTCTGDILAVERELEVEELEVTEAIARPVGIKAGGQQSMSITAATAIGGSFKHVKGQRVQIKAPETTEVVTCTEAILAVENELGVEELEVTEAIARPVGIEVGGQQSPEGQQS